MTHWPEGAGAEPRCVQHWVILNEAQLRGHSQERGMECPSWPFQRGEKLPERFALLQLGDEGNVCAPRMSQVSPREAWEVRASFSASHARTLASSLSLIFIHMCNSHQEISTRVSNQLSCSLWGQGQGNLSSQLWENGNACGVWLGTRFRSWRKARDMRPNLILDPVLVFDQSIQHMGEDSRNKATGEILAVNPCSHWKHWNE